MTSSQHKIIANTCKAFLLIFKLTETMSLLLWQAHVTAEQPGEGVQNTIRTACKQAILLQDHICI